MPERTCSGACCAVFPYTSGLPEIHRRADAGCGQSRKLVDMLIELAPGEAVERAEKYGVDFSPYHDDGNAGVAAEQSLYTCSWWDEETRLCTNYDDVPGLPLRRQVYGELRVLLRRAHEHHHGLRAEPRRSAGEARRLRLERRKVP